MKIQVLFSDLSPNQMFMTDGDVILNGKKYKYDDSNNACSVWRSNCAGSICIELKEAEEIEEDNDELTSFLSDLADQIEDIQGYVSEIQHVLTENKLTIESILKAKLSTKEAIK